MSTNTLLRKLRPISASRHSLSSQAQRSFITLPGTEAQSLTATRILPYNSDSLYTLIADVDSYSSFLPYCIASSVTKWSSLDANGKRWPSEADLKVGWGGYEENFTSRLFCVPGSIVEALSGEAVTRLSKSDVPHHSATFDSPATRNEIFKSLSTRWVFKPFHGKQPTGQPQTGGIPPIGQTEVHLAIDFQFANPIYAALSNAVTPKVAGVMIEAFELRARNLLGVPGTRQNHPSDSVFSSSQKIGV